MFILGAIWLAVLPPNTWKITLEDLDLYVEDSFSTNLVAIADDGTILFKDNKEVRLLFVNENGELRKAFGKKGMGPGEFYNIDGLAWIADLNAFFVTDRGTKRVSKFNTQGELLEEFTTQFLRGPVFDQQGNFYFMKRSGGDNYQNYILSYSLADNSEHQLFAADMEKIATIMVWHGHLVYDPGSNFLVATHSGKEPIYILDKKTGKQLETWNPKLPTIPLTKEFRDQYMRDFMGRVFSKGRPPKGFQVDHRDEWPLLHTLKVDRQDRIWIFLHRAGDDMPTPFRVYDTKGTLLGMGKFQGRPQYFTKDYLYVIKEAEKGHVLVRHEPDLLLKE